MVFEDFTTYLEHDVPNRLSETVTRVTFTNLQLNDDVYISDDKGANHFGNFEHLFTIRITASDASDTNMTIWTVSDTLDTFSALWSANDNAIVCDIYSDSGNLALSIRDCNNHNGDWMVPIPTVGTTYYCTAKRDGSTGTIKIYSDAGRTVLIDTVTITVNTALLRYIIPVSSYEDASTNKISGYHENLDLQEGVADVSAGIKYQGVELARDDTSPVKIETPGGTIGVKVVATNDPDASAIRVRVDGATTKSFKKKV